MSTLPRRKFTPKEYLALERAADYRSQYFDSEIFAMGGSSRRHNRIALNVAFSLNGQLKDRPCEVFVADMRVKVISTGLYTYPDVVVVCGQPLFEDEDEDTLLNPRLVVEVLSKTTEAFDRGGKLDHYRRFDSLHDYVMIAQKKRLVEHYSRQADGLWSYRQYSSPDDVVALPSIDCTLPLLEVYDRVRLDS